MPSQAIKPIDDGVKLVITDDNDNTYTICFHCPPGEELHVSANADGTFEMKRVDADGVEHPLGLNPAGGSVKLGE